jgi:hypothetical protein
VTYDEAITNAVTAAEIAADAASSFENIGDEHPQGEAFLAYYRDQAIMHAQGAQAWAAIAAAVTTHGLQYLEDTREEPVR